MLISISACRAAPAFIFMNFAHKPFQNIKIFREFFAENLHFRTETRITPPPPSPFLIFAKIPSFFCSYFLAFSSLPLLLHPNFFSSLLSLSPSSSPLSPLLLPPSFSLPLFLFLYEAALFSISSHFPNYIPSS